MYLTRKQHDQNIKKKEALIEHSKESLVKSMDEDIKKLDRLTKILGNGITLQIFVATRNHHAK